MGKYELLRNELEEKLINVLCNKDLEFVLHSLDIVMSNYDVSDRATSLEVLDTNGTPKIVEYYLSVKRLAGFSEGTLKGYKLTLTNFYLFINKNLLSVTSNDIRMYLYYKMNTDSMSTKRKMKESSIDRIRICINAFYNWLCQEEYIDKNPCSKLSRIKEEKNHKSAMTMDELEYFRNACYSVRERAIVETFYSTGCRVSELINIKIKDIDFNKKEIVVFGKGKKYRTVYLNAKSILEINKYLASRKDNSEYLFVGEKGYRQLSKAGVEYIIKSIAERDKEHIKTHVTCHILRHTCATHALQKGMSIEEVQKLLGHANINTTMVYLDLDENKVKTKHANYF